MKLHTYDVDSRSMNGDIIMVSSKQTRQGIGGSRDWFSRVKGEDGGLVALNNAKTNLTNWILHPKVVE
jgi:hypothetical protein